MKPDVTSNLLGALALSLTDEILAASRRISGLSPSACAAVVTLGPYPDTTIKLLARALGLTHSVTVRLVDDLVANGLIKRQPGRDRREVTLRLTAKGGALRARIISARSAVLDEALGALDAPSKQGLGDALAAMLTRLTRDRARADHMCRLCDENTCVPDFCPVEREAVRLTEATR
ncbi:MarR family winged helix-turn-helix transcriptional regulator [Rhizobium sp. AU243]|uniref:MarR family winged helix-turn-helix transcriptional regulator n=1 Tax=Rhizobium sp. AU243 TaxID=2303425 RepID=UPI0010CBBA58|nr:MarR family winged helix-turn-helix transcriptional regulator [Rhizobium sp. AU243]TKV70453.1 MarR family transcriptional regulator [Rhizobium sp. AU243]